MILHNLIIKCLLEWVTEFDLGSCDNFDFVFFLFETIIKTKINLCFFFRDTIKRVTKLGGDKK